VLDGQPADAALAVECSTLSHDWVLELAAAVTDRDLRYLDCPVTGLPDAAAAGRLTLLVGADDDDLRAAGPLLQALATEVLHFGPVGAGTAYKLMVNLMGAVQIAAAAEGMALAERAGLDPALVARAVASGQAASPQVVRNTDRFVEGNHSEPVTFCGRLRRKDADYGVRLARTLGVAAPFGETALAGLDELVAAGLGDLNESSIIEIARRDRQSDGDRRGHGPYRDTAPPGDHLR
jgi:3-hydroxyisobutyrate dehydrogenase